ncbi:MAG: elongation factor P [Mediterranea sp.]|jgi:elongation factor P|nr:elongation factor P [Mediterranea sp.]
MATTADIRNGMCIALDGEYYTIVEFLHVKPGKGGAFVRTKLKKVTTGINIERNFSVGTKIDEVRIEHRAYQFLYKDNMEYNFMNQETFEQVSIQKGLITGVQFLKEEETVEVVSHAESETILYVEVPIKVVLRIISTDPGVKGNTATNATKSAVVETGAAVRVPLFINEGELIEVDTRDGSYVGRIKG